MSESVILCEGYHDRAFWKGWLTHLACTDLGAPIARSSGSAQVLDPWGAEVKGGQYGYLSKSGHFLRVVPCHGKSRIRRIADIRFQERTSKSLLRMVINVDSDSNMDGTPGTSTGLQLQDIEQFLRTIDPATARNADGEIEIDRGATTIALVRWECADAHHPTLPPQQTLERLVSAALIEAYPARAQAVQDWLGKRPNSPPAGPKEHAWSHMAGWYAEHGCEAFYSNLWNDPALVQTLESRLRASGAWRIATTLAS